MQPCWWSRGKRLIEEPGRRIDEARQEIESLQRELAETNSGTIAWTVELEESRETLARQAEALRRANRELEAVNSELNAFAYSVSHDLRAPLRSILGFTDILVEDHAASLDADALSALERVRSAAMRMNELVTDLLQLSRAATTEVECDELDLTAIAAQVVDSLRQVDDSREVSVTIAPGMRCSGDARLIRVAMENLIENAWKFTSTCAEPHISVGVDGQAGQQVFFVSDNGAGFDMRYADRLFAPFERLHATEEFPGTGVGLATVRRIVRRHGGRIWAEAEVGKGACFWFTLDNDESPPSRGRSPGEEVG